MDHITTAQPIAVRPINMDIAAAAGEPGTCGRVAVFTVLDILSRAPSYQHCGRGPETYDWLGLVREVVGDTLAACTGDEEPLDDFLIYSADWERGPSVDAARYLFVDRWGLREIAFADAKPGDVLLFGMPTAHAGIKLPDIDTGTIHKSRMESCMASVYWGRPPGQQFVNGWWGDRAATAFTWSAP